MKMPSTLILTILFGYICTSIAEDFPSFYDIFERSLLSDGDFPKLEFEDNHFARLKREQTDSKKDESESSEGVNDFDYADRYRSFVEKHFRDRDNQRKNDEIKADKDYEYRFNYEPSADYERIKNLSEQQAQELKKNPGNCKSVTKDNMICQICEDASSGSKSESCAFASAPNHKKYAFTKERNYNSKDDQKPQSEEDCESGEEGGEADDYEDGDEIEENNEEEDEEQGAEEEEVEPQKRYSPLVQKPNNQENEKQINPQKRYLPQADIAKINGGGYRYLPATKDVEPVPIGDYSYKNLHTQVFPGPLAANEKLQKKAKNNDDVHILNYNSRKDVDKVLEEFRNRDWSKCTKAKKKELTCYQCKDPSGVKHEECMYISEPQNQKLTQKQTKNPKKKVIVTKKVTKKTSPKGKKDNVKITKKTKKVTIKKGNNYDISPIQRSAKLIDATVTPSDKQTVKRTISVRSKVNNDKEPARVMHYEHQIMHYTR